MQLQRCQINVTTKSISISGIFSHFPLHPLNPFYLKISHPPEVCYGQHITELMGESIFAF